MFFFNDVTKLQYVQNNGMDDGLMDSNYYRLVLNYV
jgi:hypothetical protein